MYIDLLTSFDGGYIHQESWDLVGWRFMGLQWWVGKTEVQETNLHIYMRSHITNNNNNKRPLTPKSMPPAGDDGHITKPLKKRGHIIPPSIILWLLHKSHREAPTLPPPPSHAPTMPLSMLCHWTCCATLCLLQASPLGLLPTATGHMNRSAAAAAFNDFQRCHYGAAWVALCVLRPSWPGVPFSSMCLCCWGAPCWHSHHHHQKAFRKKSDGCSRWGCICGDRAEEAVAVVIVQRRL